MLKRILLVLLCTLLLALAALAAVAAGRPDRFEVRRSVRIAAPAAAIIAAGAGNCAGFQSKAPTALA